MVFKNVSFPTKISTAQLPSFGCCASQCLPFTDHYFWSCYTEPKILHKIAHLPELRTFFKLQLKLGNEDC